MTRLKWRSFLTEIPMDHCAILVRDHEGNCSPGVWDGCFHSFFPIPIGFKKKWTYVKVLVKKTEHMDIINADVFFLENGNSMRIEEIYDFEDPVKLTKPKESHE